jgi:hypothetical protein
VNIIKRKGRKREEKREPNRPSLSLSPEALTPPKRRHGMQTNKKMAVFIFLFYFKINK